MDSHFHEAYIRAPACPAFRYQTIPREPPEVSDPPLPHLPWTQCSATGPQTKSTSEDTTTTHLATRWPRWLAGKGNQLTNDITLQNIQRSAARLSAMAKPLPII